MAEKTEIKTRIVLRNAELSAWEKSTVKLLPGEMAMAKLDGEYAGSYKIRIGTGDKTWNELSDQGQLIIPAANVEGLNEAIAALSTSYYETSDIETLSGTYVNGDIAVEKKQLGSTDKYEYCAYRYDTTDNKWKALDGNYSAENVYFPENMTFTYQFGRHTVPGTGSYTLSCAGQSVKTMLNDAFAEEKKISKPTPSVSITGSNGNYEVGTSVTPTFSLGFDAKTYAYGSNTNKAANSTTGVTASTYKITYNRQGTSTELTGNWTGSVTDTAITVVEGDNLKTNALTATFTLPAEGTYIPLTNIGNNDPDHRVTAVTNNASDNNKKVTGYYKYFWTYKAEGSTIAGLTQPKVTQADITALNEDGKALQSSTIRNWTNGTGFPSSLSTTKMQQMFFVCKKGKKSKIEIKGSNPPAPQTVQGPFDLTVKDAAGVDVVYSIFVVDNSTAQGGADTFTITAS